MERLRRLTRLWSWLPAFRAVAETEHVQNAAALLRTTPSTLSRAVGLLEHDLGQTLFSRVGRSIALTAAGQEFLASVRAAMRELDDGVARLEGDALAGAVHVSTVGELTLPFVVPALTALAARHPSLVPFVYSDPSWDVAAELLRGRVDVAFVTEARPQRRLVVERLSRFASGVYCGKGHPLFSARKLRVDDLAPHAFVVPISSDEHEPIDRWPPELARKIALHVTEVHQAFAICASGRLLAALPDFLAGVLCSRDTMRRLPIELLPETSIFAMRRPTAGRAGSAEAVLDAIRAELAKLT